MEGISNHQIGFKFKFRYVINQILCSWLLFCHMRISLRLNSHVYTVMSRHSTSQAFLTQQWCVRVQNSRDMGYLK